MKISKYMTTKLITASPEMSVKDAFLIMRTHRVRHLPVVSQGRLVGIISDRDLRRPKWVDALDDWTMYYRIDDETTVRDVMTKNPEVVYTFNRVRKAVRILREQRYGALPVLNKEGELVGILSAHDLLGALEELLVQPEEEE
ncbi:MAG: CBS domain-containing protein [Planctomycetota bacterium]